MIDQFLNTVDVLDCRPLCITNLRFLSNKSRPRELIFMQ